MKYSPVPLRDQQKQPVFSSTEFGHSKKKRNSFVLINGSENNNNKFNFAKTLLLFHLKARGTHFVGQHAFVHHLECTKPLNGLDEKLICACLRWATEDEIDYTLKNIEENQSEKFIETGEWFDIVPFNTIASSIYVLHSNFG